MPFMFAAPSFQPNMYPMASTADPFKQAIHILPENGYNGGFQPIIVMPAGGVQNINSAIHFTVRLFYFIVSKLYYREKAVIHRKQFKQICLAKI